jgi:hypothetical protein
MTASLLPPARPSLPRLATSAVLLTTVSLALAVFSAFPWTASPRDRAVVRVAFKHVASFQAEEARELSREELERLPRHMRPQSAERARTGTRRDTTARVTLGDRVLLVKRYRPSGLRHDGPTFGYEELAVPPGRHRLEVTLADAGREAEEGEGRGRWQVMRELDIRPGQAILVEFSEETGLAIR